MRRQSRVTAAGPACTFFRSPAHMPTFRPAFCVAGIQACVWAFLPTDMRAGWSADKTSGCPDGSCFRRHARWPDAHPVCGFVSLLTCRLVGLARASATLSACGHVSRPVFPQTKTRQRAQRFPYRDTRQILPGGRGTFYRGIRQIFTGPRDSRLPGSETGKYRGTRQETPGYETAPSRGTRQHSPWNGAGFKR